MMRESRTPTLMLTVPAVIYLAASLFHFSHNAVFLDDYPNLPDWLSRGQVWIAWFGVTAVGVVGYLLTRSQYKVAGLIVLAVYAVLGFDGLAHYAVAPLAAHTVAMNLSIWVEVVSAALLLMAIVMSMFRLSRGLTAFG